MVSEHISLNKIISIMESQRTRKRLFKFEIVYFYFLIVYIFKTEVYLIKNLVNQTIYGIKKPTIYTSMFHLYLLKKKNHFLKTKVHIHREKLYFIA